MSNKTDGKKALEAGDFSLAEQKILKALDNHPDDSELWWAMMLIKSGLRNDEELASSVSDGIVRAALNGEEVPKTPFETHYCKNALRYARDGRKREFINNLYAEINAARLAANGKKLKPPIPREKKLPDPVAIFTAAEYTTVFLMVIGVWLLCYSLLTHKEWALWTGFAFIVVFALASFILLRVIKKAGGSSDAASVVLFTAVALSALVLLIVGIFCEYTLITVMAAAALAIAAAFGLYKLLARRSSLSQRAARSKDAAPTRDPHELSRRESRSVKANTSGGRKLEKEVKDEYKDEFD